MLPVIVYITRTNFKIIYKFCFRLETFHDSHLVRKHCSNFDNSATSFTTQEKATILFEHHWTPLVTLVQSYVFLDKHSHYVALIDPDGNKMF